jgi:hypothetical protein
VPHQHEDSNVETSFVPLPQVLQRESATIGIQITIVWAAVEYVSNPKTARNVPGRQGRKARLEEVREWCDGS